MTGPSLVMATVCSKCALKLPSTVTAVQPSSSTFTSARAGVDHRLNGEHHARLQARAFARLAVVGHLRIFMHVLADAVANKLPHHAKAFGLAHALHRMRDIEETPARPTALSIAA